MLCILSRSKKCLHSIWTCILMFSNYSINICTIREWRKGNFFSIIKKERLPHSSCFERETCFKAGKQSAPWVERTPPWTLLIEVWWTRSVEAFSLWPSQICRTSSNGINVLKLGPLQGSYQLFQDLCSEGPEIWIPGHCWQLVPEYEPCVLIQ